MPRATVLKPQSYETFIYKSTGSQTGNRYNSWSDLMTAITKQEGFKLIIFEQNETLPAGAYNLDYCTLGGNGLAHDAGGFTVTFPTGVTVTSWVGAQNKADYGIRLRSTSSSPILTTSVAGTLSADRVATVESTTAEFVRYTSNSGSYILSASGSARLQNAGYEILNVTGSAMGVQVVLAFAGGGVAIQNNIIRSTNAQIFVQVLQTVIVDASSFPTTQANLVIGAPVNLNFSYGTNIDYKATTLTSGTYAVTKAYGHRRCNATSGNITLNLPAAVGLGTRFSFKKTDASGNTVTVARAGSDTIDGATSKVISTQYSGFTIQDAASGIWDVIT